MPRKSMQCSEGAFGAFSAPTTCSPNNNSFYDAGPHTDAEVERILQKGFTQEFKSREYLVEKLGPDVVVSKLGCVLKVKISGDIKARLVTDLRRPGGNDALSQRCQGKAIPSHLAEVQRAATPCRESDFFLAWSGDSL